ncbi:MULTISPECIES: YebO family protein [unclassified Symbiopectobacterium]|uniref:YebO family protein n=1 Tax=unclassified Symbiopectobacterium TaxID=2794573 RepID=UPI002227D335|nr:MULTISPECIES: YebO family protein [unclassified Symbiopectobacterium]MCW2473688.1 YebO family protein [Candidatus Symbiopectobacterium sp. NZEC151]MCW2484888.1 YebO family protein [Candidatus Symbiopectobacterium sp. NZEC127]
MLMVLFAALVWFFVNRASVRANEKIRLLQEILEQQRLQTALLQSLAPATAVITPPEPETLLHPAAAPAPEFDAFNVIPER